MAISRVAIEVGETKGWSEVELDGRKVYVSSSYVSTEKPAVQQSTPSAGGQTSTGGSQSTPSSSQSSSSGSSGGDSVIPPPPSGERPTDLRGADNGDLELTEEQKREAAQALVDQLNGKSSSANQSNSSTANGAPPSPWGNTERETEFSDPGESNLTPEDMEDWMNSLAGSLQLG